MKTSFNSRLLVRGLLHGTTSKEDFLAMATRPGGEYAGTTGNMGRLLSHVGQLSARQLDKLLVLLPKPLLFAEEFLGEDLHGILNPTLGLYRFLVRYAGLDAVLDRQLDTRCLAPGKQGHEGFYDHHRVLFAFLRDYPEALTAKQAFQVCTLLCGDLSVNKAVEADFVLFRQLLPRLPVADQIKLAADWFEHLKPRDRGLFLPLLQDPSGCDVLWELLEEYEKALLLQGVLMPAAGQQKTLKSFSETTSGFHALLQESAPSKKS